MVATRAQLEAAQAEIDALALAGRAARERLQQLKREGLVEEPTEKNSVVRFTVRMKLYSGKQNYDYAAILAGNGRWYTTGANSPGNGRTWEQLWAWINEHQLVGDFEVAMWPVPNLTDF